jgi:hypothetical protein
MPSFYYTKADLIQFKTELYTQQTTIDTAFTGINKYILYKDPNFTQKVGQILYTATVYNTPGIAYNPYVVTLFIDDGKNISGSGAHDDSKTQFFPTGVKQQATVTDQTGFEKSYQYINIEPLDNLKRKVTLVKELKCGC